MQPRRCMQLRIFLSGKKKSHLGIQDLGDVIIIIVLNRSITTRRFYIFDSLRFDVEMTDQK